MALQPQLKTGALAQYPFRRTLLADVRVVRFIDGSEQRMARHALLRNRLAAPLELLTEGEAAAIGAFVEDALANPAAVEYFDAAANTQRTKCRPANATLTTVHEGRAGSSTVVEMEEEY
jgi:hypothetical protein